MPRASGDRLRDQELLQDFVERTYLPRRPGAKPGTRKSITYTLRSWGKQLERPPTIGDLRPSYEAVSAFLCWLTQQKLRPASVNCHWRVLKALAGELHRLRIVRRRRSQWPAKLKVPKRRPKAFREQDLIALVAWCRLQKERLAHCTTRDVYLTALVLTFFDTGGRAGAIHALLRDDIDFSNGALRLRAEASKDLEEIPCWLKPETLAALQALDRDTHGKMFAVISQSWMFRLLRQAFDAVGMPSEKHRRDLTHKIRRSTISHLARKSLELARRQAGHSDARLTQDIYCDDEIVNEGDKAVDYLPSIGGQPSAVSLQSSGTDDDGGGPPPPPPSAEPLGNASPAAPPTEWEKPQLRLFAG